MYTLHIPVYSTYPIIFRYTPHIPWYSTYPSILHISQIDNTCTDTTTVTVEIHPGRESPASVPGGRKSPAVRRRANKQKQPSIKRQSIISSVSTTHHSKAYSCYKFFSYLLKKIRWLTIVLVNLLWRFLELHMHKIVCLTLFATTISQISVLYWILLVFLVFIVVPLPYMNTLTYPIVTLYLGIITVVKTIFQFPVILEKYFTFPLANSSFSNCPSIEVCWSILVRIIKLKFTLCTIHCS